MEVVGVENFISQNINLCSIRYYRMLMSVLFLISIVLLVFCVFVCFFPQRSLEIYSQSRVTAWFFLGEAVLIFFFLYPVYSPTGETIKIVIEDYVQHLSGYHFKLKFDPELLFNQRFQYQNRIAAEFNTLYHWHPLLPDTFQIHNQEYTFQQFLYNNSIMLEHGLSHMVKSFSKQSAGRVGIFSSY